MKNDLIFIEEPPPLKAYQNFREAVGWEALSDEAVNRGLGNALYSVHVKKGENIIGCGRVVGDGAIYFYIQDIIVLPEYQGRGIGARIMDYVMRYLEANANHNSFIGLMAAQGVAGFYLKYGFKERPAGRPGMYRKWKK